VHKSPLAVHKSPLAVHKSPLAQHMLAVCMTRVLQQAVAQPRALQQNLLLRVRTSSL
jgi:hypothetical protein